MSSEKTRRSAPPAAHWRSWPIAEASGPVWCLLALVAAAAAAAGFTMSSLGWGLAAAGAIVAAAWRAFLPVEFDVNAQGITQQVLRRRRRIPWKAIARCEIGRDGLWLSPTTGRHWLSAGLYLPWGDHRAEVLALVEYYLHSDEAAYGFESIRH